MKQRLRRHARRVRLVIYAETLFDAREHLYTFLGAFTGLAAIGLALLVAVGVAARSVSAPNCPAI